MGIYVNEVPPDKFTYILYSRLCKFKLFNRNTPPINKYIFVIGKPGYKAVGSG